MAKKSESISIAVPQINLQTLRVKVIGTSPLIIHKFAEKTKKEILDKQMGNKTKAKPKRNPIKDFMESLYWLTEEPTEHTEEAFEKALKEGARFGFPATGFKQSAVSAGYRAKITKDRVSVMGAFYIEGEFVEIKGTPQIREDMVRLQKSSADLRYRGEFKEWEAEMTVKYNADVLSATELVNLFNYGGFACGVGEWRVEKEGQYGMYRVAVGNESVFDEAPKTKKTSKKSS